MKSLDLHAIRKLAEAATPGPIDIHRFDENDGEITYQLQCGGKSQEVLAHVSDENGDNPRAKHDAALWAVARETILALLDRVEAAERNIEQSLALIDVAHEVADMTRNRRGEVLINRSIRDLWEIVDARAKGHGNGS